MEETYIYYHPYDGSLTSDVLTGMGLEQYLLDSHKKAEYTDSHIRRKDPHGKPWFDKYRDIFHNVSHSGKWWVCAYGESENGLDLQKNGRNDTGKLAKRFFHPLEYAWLQGKDPDQFYRLWAYNESYLKYTGEGLARDMRSFSLICDPLSSADPGMPGLWQREIPFPDKNYWLVLTAGCPQRVIIKRLNKKMIPGT